LSGDTLAVGASYERSGVSGINGDQSDTTTSEAGAVYVFARTGITWLQQAYIKPSNMRPHAWFGTSLALDGDTLAVGSEGETSSSTGVNGDQAASALPFEGAAYVFTRTGTTWSQRRYVKASNTRTYGDFGISIALSAGTLVVGSNDSSNATGVNGNETDTSAPGSGAVYVFP
jgi:trimeric autotransporter adhesin